MRCFSLVVVPVLVVSLVAWHDVIAQEGPPVAARIDSGASMPHGCASCHVPGVPGPHGPMDARLSVALPQRDADHPDLTEDVADTPIPELCQRCHNGRREEDLGPIVHRIHFQEPEGRDNHFQAEFGGQCLMCHTLDAESGVVTLKSGMEAVLEGGPDVPAEPLPEAPDEADTEGGAP